MASKSELIVLEKSQISPPPDTVGNQTLPLTFFDVFFLNQPLVHQLLFYEFPHPTNYFVQTLVPKLKRSLAVTLQHFFPFAGNLIIFPTQTKYPEIRYVEGDSVAFTFAESSLDFNDLTGYHPRACDKFYPLIPLLGHATKFSDYIKIPIFSVQVTIFPNMGISIGCTSHHSLSDASTFFGFLKAWASITSLGTDELLVASGFLPLYDRVIVYPDLDNLVLSRQNLETFSEEYQPPSLAPTDNVRATFVLSRQIINELKKRVTTQLPNIKYASSFTATFAYICSCIAKIHNKKIQVFSFPVDCRARMNPPVPSTYFGNCIVPCTSWEITSLLKEKEGFLTAAKLLGETLHKMVNNKDGIMKSIETDFNSEYYFTVCEDVQVLTVAGTPKLKFYDMDFGWGRPKKYEVISIDNTSSISMNACRDSTEDVEIGISLSALEMKVFMDFLKDGLKEYVV